MADLSLARAGRFGARDVPVRRGFFVVAAIFFAISLRCATPLSCRLLSLIGAFAVVLWPRTDPDRNGDRKRRSRAEGALDLDVTAQHTREPPRNRQAEAGPALRPGDGPLGLLEGLENSCVIFVRDPDAAVLDAQIDEPRPWCT